MTDKKTSKDSKSDEKSSDVKVESSEKKESFADPSKVSFNVESEKAKKKISDAPKSNSKECVYQFKPQGLVKGLHVCETEIGPVVEVKENETITLSDEMIASCKDLQILINSGDLKKVSR